ncbi:LacI family DNA-binding transcriptional regulator [Cryptosporangium phraense]|nr:LacI family DNA-binding transcriptional regulator [Cryptosporangium phraense]
MTDGPAIRRPTVRDVAEAAGVSIASVSRVIAGATKPVSEATRRKVIEAANRLGYTLNTSAQSLSTGRTGTVGLVVPDLGNQYFTTIAQEVVLAARESGFYVLVADSLDATHTEPTLAHQTQLRSDALILCSPRASATALAGVLGVGKPVVTVNRRLTGAASVCTEVTTATAALVDSLLDQGHVALAFIGASADSEQMQNRWRLIESRAAEVGGRSLRIDQEEADIEGAVRSAVAAGCTGLLAANDVQAAAILQALTGLGLRVPADVSVVGFDDTPLARWVTPRLTTAHMHERQVGQAAWAAVYGLLADPTAITHTEFTADPVFRESVGPASLRHTS